MPAALKSYLQSIEDDLSDGLVGVDESDGAIDDAVMVATLTKKKADNVKLASKYITSSKKKKPSPSKKTKPVKKPKPDPAHMTASSSASPSSTRNPPPAPKKPSDNTTRINQSQAIPVYVLGGQSKPTTTK